MIDITLSWGTDLQVAPHGDIDVTYGSDLTKQRLLRRLLTNQGDYVWQADYGAGLAQFVGEPTQKGRLLSIVRKQTLKEPTIDQTQPVAVTLDERQGEFSDCISLSIQFKDTTDGNRIQSVALVAKA